MKLRLLAAGRGGHAIVVVPGFLTQADELGRWVPALRSSGFGGDIWSVGWKSGSPSELGGCAATALVGLAPIVFGVSTAVTIPPVLVGTAARARSYWRSKVELARRIAPQVCRALLRLRARYRYREITLIAHSLGVELTWAMVEGARSLPANRFVLLGGASSATDGCWDALDIDADVYNVGHRGDRVLQFFYQFAEGELPLGLADAGGQIINVDVGHLHLGTFGHDYSRVFAEFGAPLRWRPRQFGR